MKEVGLDLGYGYTKVISDDKEYIFASVIGTPDVSRFGVEANGTQQLVMDGETYLVGEEAVEQSRITERNEDRRWIESREYRILFSSALHRVINGNGGVHQVGLVTGLPVAFYDDKDDLQHRLIGHHTVQCKGETPRYIHIQACRVVIQPFGSLFSLALDREGNIVDVGLMSEKVGIIDIGSKTTNILATTRAKEVRRESSSVNSGGWDIVRGVRARLDQICEDIELRDHQIADAIRSRSVDYYGRTVDLSSDIDEIVAPFAQQVSAVASQVWNRGAEMKTILITGGGAYLVGDILRRYFQRHADVRVIPNPQMANAWGYFRYAKFLSKIQGW